MSKTIRIDDDVDEILEGYTVIYRVLFKENFTKRSIRKRYEKNSQLIKADSGIVKKAMAIANERKLSILKKILFV